MLLRIRAFYWRSSARYGIWAQGTTAQNEDTIATPRGYRRFSGGFLGKFGTKIVARMEVKHGRDTHKATKYWVSDGVKMKGIISMDER